MKINFSMWRTAIWQLVKMDDKKEWDALDVVSKWLIATRSAVTLVTVYSCIIAGLLAWRDGFFSWGPFLVLTISLFIFGALVLLFYTWPLKYWALGELAIFLIWGPIMIAGVYFVLALGAGQSMPVNLWNVALAGIPFGLSVASINVGKHIDKRDDDIKKGVGTFPVRAGEKFARFVNQFAVVMTYAVIVYLVIVHYFTPIMLIVFFAGKRALLVLGVLNKPRPSEPPKEWPGWPTWFSGFAFYHNRMFGGLLILGLILDSALRVIPFTAPLILKFWPM